MTTGIIKGSDKKGIIQNLVASPASHTPAHDVTATVAPFRAWRGSQLIIARGPTGVTIKRRTLSGNPIRVGIMVASKAYFNRNPGWRREPTLPNIGRWLTTLFTA